MLICCLLFIGGALGQEMDLKITTKVAELQKAGVDTIIIYYTYCNGRLPMLILEGDTAKCHTDESKYLLWVSKGINHVQKFDGCYNYNELKNKSSESINLIKFHFALLRKESIKEVIFRKKIDGKYQLLFSSVDHSCHAELEFYIGAKKIFKNINYYALGTKFIADYDHSKIKYFNLNYAYNQHTYLKKLKDFIEKETSTISFAKAN